MRRLLTPLVAILALLPTATTPQQRPYQSPQHTARHLLLDAAEDRPANRSWHSDRAQSLRQLHAQHVDAAGQGCGGRLCPVGRTRQRSGVRPRGVPSSLPMESPAAIEAALARIAEVMDPAEDVLVLYTTSHGAPFGIIYNDGNEGFSTISPTRLSRLLDTHGSRRLLIVSACYSGVFVPVLSGPQTAIFSAASSDRSSFGCVAENDWTLTLATR